MNIDEQAFQKRLAGRQVIATIGVAVGAAIFASGLSLFLFSSGLIIDSIGASEETRQHLKAFGKISTDTGFAFGVIGVLILFGGPFLMIYMINKDKVKT